MLKDAGLSKDFVMAGLTIALTEDDDVDALVKKLGISIDPAPYVEQIEEDVKTATFFPDTVSVLGQLRQQGYKLGVISNISRLYKAAYNNLGLSNMVDDYVFSCEEQLLKPEAEIYEVMSLRLGVEPENCLMIGDNFENDVRGPWAAGMQSLLLDREERSSFPESIQGLDGVLTYLNK